MNISVVRATAITPIILAMEKINAPIFNLLEEVHIPQPECYEPADWVASERILQLCDCVKKKVGVPSFSYLAAQAGTIGDMGQFGTYLLRSLTLNEALTRYCDDQGYYRSSANFFLMHDQKFAWFCRQTNGRVENGPEEFEIYTISEMLKVVRLSLGPNWWPDRIFFQSKHAPSFEDEAEEFGANLCFGKDFGGFAIPTQFLALPLRYADDAVGHEYFAESKEENWTSAPGDFVDFLMQILPSYMRDGEINIEMIADILDLSVRGLQRQLEQYNLCYRDLLDRIRFQSALKMIHRTDVKLIDIAVDLGYGHAASLTRSFHRWAGVSPTQFRAQLLKTVEKSVQV